MSFKRKMLSFIESTLNVRIVRPERAANAVALQFETLHLQEVFERFDVDCVFDVGANAGQYVEKLRHEVGYEGDIVSFEPIPELVSKLRGKAKSDPRWHVVDIALDKSDGKKTFHVMAENVFSSLLLPSAREVNVCQSWNRIQEEVDVETRTLTCEFTYWAQRLEFKRPYLKMDTQGNDLAVADGGRDVLRYFIGIQTELAVKTLYEGAPDFIQSINYFRSRGFDLSALVPNNLGHFPRLIEIDAILLRDDLL